VHLKGHFAPTKFASAYWREQSKSGNAVSAAIINTSSDSGLFSNAGQSAYDAAKAGIASLTLCLARELERYGVRVNAIAPRARTRLTATVGVTETPDADTFDALSPANVAPVVAWLAGPGAAGVNGQVFAVGGGTVVWLSGWHQSGILEQDKQWTVDELAAHQEQLFGGGNSGTPAMMIPGMNFG
jgi:NAD(P)-dependent dehydrogenase (short-subunit alcohol dehydrogenase family)